MRVFRWCGGFIVVAACATHPATGETSGSSSPEVVVTATGMLFVANSTVFVLYKSGRVLSSVYDPSFVAASFYEEVLTAEERARFLKGLQLGEFAKLEKAYRTSGFNDVPNWVISTWVGGEKQTVQVEAPIGCTPVGANSRFISDDSHDETPAAFVVVMNQVCAARGRGRPWYPESFRLTWYPSDILGPVHKAEAWPADWRAFAPPPVSSKSFSRFSRFTLSGELLPPVEDFLRERHKRNESIAVGGQIFSASVSFTLPSEEAWQ
jgi:hypothetical protein